MSPTQARLNGERHDRLIRMKAWVPNLVPMERVRPRVETAPVVPEPIPEPEAKTATRPEPIKLESWFRIMEENPPQRLRVEHIQRAVASHYNVHRDELLSQRRTAHLIKPRQIAMYLAKRITLKSLPEVGKAFQGRDHTTVLHAVRKIGDLVKDDPDLAEELDILETRLRALVIKVCPHCGSTEASETSPRPIEKQEGLGL